MNRFIVGFVVVVLLIAIVIGQCYGMTEESEAEIASFYSSEKALEEEEEHASEPSIDNSSFQKHEEIDLNEIVRIPSDKPHQLLRRTGYCLSYNKETRCPNRVAWHLIAAHTDGPWPRDRHYYEDMEVPAPRSTDNDYHRSGWTRGHMCPAGDNKWDSIAMSESNMLTNICPQNAELNSGVWNRIEMDCRKWAKRYGSVYIVCGPLFYNKEHETIGANKVVVPEAFFKVILCLQGKPKAIGFVVKNNAGTKKKDQYVNTVDEVERMTGYDFFPALSDDIEEVVEANADIKEW